MEVDFSPRPHEEAIKLIENKPVVTRAVFDGLLPELRGRAFTITGVEGAHVMQRVRDSIASLAGSEKSWDVIKDEVVAELDPYLGEGADKRAVLLMRTHGFQAFQAANWNVAQADADTTHLQYLATEDTHVRDTHLALNGLIIPKDDPFWLKHYPPWEWGCRCRARPMNPDLVDEAQAEDKDRNPDDKLVMEGPALEKLRQGHLQRDGQSYNVTPPSDTDKEGAYQWNPGDLKLPLAELEKRYDPEVWAGFKEWAGNTTLSPGGRRTVWDWLSKQPKSKGLGTREDTRPPVDETGKEQSGVTAAATDQVSLEGTVQKLGLDAAEVQPHQMAALWEELKEENPVPLEEIISVKGKRSGELAVSRLTELANDVISRLPAAVVRALPKLEISVEPTRRGTLGGYIKESKKLIISPKVARLPGEAKRVVYHELLHWVHIHGPAEYAAEIKAHFLKRTENEPLALMPYAGIVVGKKDKWHEMYGGRVYGGPLAELEMTHLGLEIPTTYMEIMGLTPEKMAVHWNRPEDKETLLKVLKIFFNH